MTIKVQVLNEKNEVVFSEDAYSVPPAELIGAEGAPNMKTVAAALVKVAA